MAWVVCKRCGTDVGAGAAMCPLCGADPRTGRGGPTRRGGPQLRPGWHRLVRYLTISAGVGLLFVATLRVLGGVVADSTGWNLWYEGAIALVGCVALIVGVGMVTGSGITARLRGEGRATADPVVGLGAVACGLVVLVVGLAVVQGPKAGSGNGALDGGALPNAHWAGYQTNSAVHSVAASWTEPSIAAPVSGNSDVSFWAGLGGQNTPRLAQIGTAADGQAGQAVTYTAWYEMYPKPARGLDSTVISVHPGDRLSASVTEISGGRFRLMLVNHTTQERFSIMQTDLGIPTTNGAVIAELPTAPYKLSLASFGSVRFTDCTVDGRPLGDSSLTMCEVYKRGATEARTSPLGADGASFSVRRQEAGSP